MFDGKLHEIKSTEDVENVIIREVLNGKSFDCPGELVAYLFLLNDDENENLRRVYFEKGELEKSFDGENTPRGKRKVSIATS